MAETGLSAEEGRAWLALSRIKQIGGARAQRLVQHCGSARSALDASARSWELALGPLGRKARKAPLELAWAADQWRRLEDAGGRLVTLTSPDYPAHLKQISSPPPALYVLGATSLNRPCIAMVGTRRASRYGIEMARQLARALVAVGLDVVSGLARGIDTCVHLATLESGGETVAILGSGVDICYPRENKGLFEQIRGSGAIVSEFPMGTEPDARLFPRRNRLISGLSLGTIVVEAATRSGALITANYALEQNREVFAVPGEALGGRNGGCHQLIKEGAKLVECATDVLEELAGQFIPKRPALIAARPPGQTPRSPGSKPPPQPPAPAAPLSQREESIVALLHPDARHIDDLSRSADLPTAEVMGMLLRLELDGWVEQLPGQFYARRA